MSDALGDVLGDVLGDALGGATTHVLRMARTGCKSAVSFVALVVDDDVATAVYPRFSQDASVREEVIDALVRQLWLDPAIARRKALVRTVRVASRSLGELPVQLAVATVPLGLDDEDRPWGLLGVADPEVKAFGLPDVELLARIAQRLTSHIAARQWLRGAGSGAGSGPGTGPGSGAGALASSTGAPPSIEEGVGGIMRTPDLARLYEGEDPGSGLVALAALLARTGRLIGAGERAGGSIALVALEVSGVEGPPGDTLARVARAIRADLRFDDLVSGVGARGLVAVVPLAPGGTGAQALEDRLAASARAALDAALGATRAAVRTAHVTVDLASHVEEDAHDLLRAVLDKLDAG